MYCRHCESDLNHKFIDLGHAPPSNSYLTKDQLNSAEVYFPLKLYTCTNCWLVQTIDYSHKEDFFSPDYAYFSSVSKSWLQHAEEYVHSITNYLNLTSNSFVIELASNDGYLLKNFIDKDIPCLGIEPTISTALASEELGINVIKEFFTLGLAKDIAKTHKKADLIIGNNVFAHVPDINDFSRGIKEALNIKGVVTLEFPHLMELINNHQFDTIYHEHFSYLSLFTTDKIFSAVGLKIFRVEKISTHGGSLRIYGCHDNDSRKIDQSVKDILLEESNLGMQSEQYYINLQKQAESIKNEFHSFLLNAKKKNYSVGAYGAAAKGNTLLNYCGIKNDLIQFVCDGALSKQGKFLPGSHIPILEPKILKGITSLDYLVIFPWNISNEIINQLSFLKEKNTKFIVAIPQMKIF
jgi:hypothetical protein